MDQGASCPLITTKFSSMAAANKNNFLVRATMKGGTVTRMAEEYRPLEGLHSESAFRADDLD